VQPNVTCQGNILFSHCLGTFPCITLNVELQTFSISKAANGFDRNLPWSLKRLHLPSQFNSTLQSINLEHNDISGEGAEQLGTSLQAGDGGGVGLRSLNLRGNPIEDPGGLAMANMLKVRTYCRRDDSRLFQR
jgi:hypothetical protein